MSFTMILLAANLILAAIDAVIAIRFFTAKKIKMGIITIAALIVVVVAEYFGLVYLLVTHM